MSLKTRVSFLKNVAPGSALSYGRTFVAERDLVVATLPIGYDDGLGRGMSNRGEALVRGRRTHLVGRVCMDQCLIDVSNVPDVAVGDEVVLYGRQGDEQIEIEDVAEMLDTIPQEIVCAVGKRVPRVYVRH